MLFATLQFLSLWLVAGIGFWSAFVAFGFHFGETHPGDRVRIGGRIPFAMLRLGVAGAVGILFALGYGILAVV